MDNPVPKPYEAVKSQKDLDDYCKGYKNCFCCPFLTTCLYHKEKLLAEVLRTNKLNKLEKLLK